MSFEFCAVREKCLSEAAKLMLSMGKITHDAMHG